MDDPVIDTVQHVDDLTLNCSVESFGSTYVAEVIGLQDLHTFKCSLQGVKAGGKLFQCS